MLIRLIGEDIELETRFSDNVEKIVADPGMIEQVIVNLVVNARDAMPQGGKITLSTGAIDIDEELSANLEHAPTGRYIKVSVADTGVGISPEIKERIFEPFFTTKEKGSGTGLGLSMVYGIVKQHNGAVWVESAPGEGSIFHISFPAVAAETDTSKKQAAEQKKLAGGEKLLVVEDEPALRALFERMLQRLGYEVTMAANGAKALSIVETADLHPDLLITDVVMPGMNGARLSAAALELRPDLKVLYTTGYTRNAVVHNGVLDPGVQLIGKPFTVEALASKLREVLDAS